MFQISLKFRNSKQYNIENIGRNQIPNIIKVLTKYIYYYLNLIRKYYKIKKLYKIHCSKELPKKECLN